MANSRFTAEERYKQKVQKFWDKSLFVDSGCREWQGRVDRAGYGGANFKLPTRTANYAHVIAYELAVGPIPEGLTIDHLCRNRKCVNPEHLECVTFQENIKRRIVPKKQICVRGHALVADNVYSYRGHRHCKKCSIIRQQERRRKESLQKRKESEQRVAGSIGLRLEKSKK